MKGKTWNRLINEALIARHGHCGAESSATTRFTFRKCLVSALTMKRGLEMVKPLLAGDKSESKGTILMGTVKGDLHDIGKNLVIMMLEGAGFQVVDLGIDLDVEKVGAKVEEIKPQILGPLCAVDHHHA